MSDQQMNPVSVGLDDGYAFTKLALPDGRLIAIPSRARLGRANVTWIDDAEQRIFEYETEEQCFAVGEVDAEPTYFDAYPFSGLNRAIVQHGLQKAGIGGQSVHAVSGLPHAVIEYRPPGFNTRNASAAARSGRARCNIPNPMTTASNISSSASRASASPTSKRGPL